MSRESASSRSSIVAGDLEPHRTVPAPRVVPAPPLTERILTRLPGPRAVWVGAWALVPWLNLAVVWAWDAGEWTTDGVPIGEVLNRAAVSLAVLLSIRGAERIADGLRRLHPVLAEITEQQQPDVARLFRGMDGVAVPLLITAAVAAVLPADEIGSGDAGAAAIQAVTWLVVGIPLGTAVWVYVTLQTGLDRLGRGHLTLQPYRGDRSLGLRPVGRLAFTGFWMLFGIIGPLLLTGFTDLPGLILGGVVLVAGLVLFFVSLRRLNRSMVAVKQREQEWALALYARAYEQLRDDASLQVLEQQASLLSAAEGLEKRAEHIQEWPFDEAVFARVVTIASSVAAVIIARLILDPVGL